MNGSPVPPVRVLEYDLGPADALAWESAPRVLSGWRLVALVLWIGLAGAVLGVLPATLAGEPWSIRFVFLGALLLLAFWAAAMLWWNVLVRMRVRRRFRGHVAVVLEERGDRLCERVSGRETVVRTADVAAVVTLPGHVVVCIGEGEVIVPARAFADREEMAAFAARWDEASRDAAE